MNIRPVQPHRKDFLINTEWGIPKTELTKEEAKIRGLKPYKGYWVTKDEKKQLKDEYHAYRSVYLLARFLILFSVFVLYWAFSDPLIFPAIGHAAGAALLAGGIGLLGYRAWGRNITTLALAAMLLIPFILKGAPDKGAPMIWWSVSIIGLYSLSRKTARQIFKAPEAQAENR